MEFLGYTLTKEQQNAVNICKDYGKDIVKIEAFAGASKTFTLNAISQLALSDYRCLYLAFNKSIVEDAKKVFPSNVTVITQHSLAGKSTVAWRNKVKGDGRFCSSRLKNINAEFIKKYFNVQEIYKVEGMENLEYTTTGIANLALDCVNRFCTTDSNEILTRFVIDEKLANVIKMYKQESDEEKKSDLAFHISNVQAIGLKWANKIWDEMSNTESNFPITHNTYLKVWAMSNPNLSRLGYQVVMLDEAQDSNALILGVILKQNECMRILVGDRYQQIYAWNGAVNAMQSIDAQRECLLSKSFRFGEAIGNLSSAILTKSYRTNVKVHGFENIKTKFTKLKDFDCFISRTNAGVLSEMISYANTSKKIAINGGVNSLISLLKDAKMLISGTPVNTGDLAGFKNWQQVIEHSETSSGKQLKVIISLVEQYNIDELIETLNSNNVVNSTKDADIVFTTAHKAKGLEWGRVKLGSDFMMETNEDANIFYVACTRAKRELDIFSCEPVYENPEILRLVREHSN